MFSSCIEFSLGHAAQGLLRLLKIKVFFKSIEESTFIMTTDNVRNSKTVSSYITNVGKT